MTDTPVNTQALKMDRQRPFICAKEIKAVYIIGAGGTGSYVVPPLARDIYTMAANTRPQLVICDGDVVEDKNLKRQHFVATDIGKNKAVALANRYSAAFGIPVGYRDSFLSSEEEFSKLISDAGGPCLFITCVDNVKTRLLLRNAIIKAQQDDIMWIDCGNEDIAGQVILSARTPLWAHKHILKGRYPMPDVFDLYPEMHEKAKADKLPTEMSCAELAVSSPQYGFINLTAATIALNYAHDILHKEAIKSHIVKFSIRNKYTHIPLNESVIGAWSKFFDKFSTFEGFAALNAAPKPRDSTASIKQALEAALRAN